MNFFLNAFSSETRAQMYILPCFYLMQLKVLHMEGLWKVNGSWQLGEGKLNSKYHQIGSEFTILFPYSTFWSGLKGSLKPRTTYQVWTEKVPREKSYISGPRKRKEASNFRESKRNPLIFLPFFCFIKHVRQSCSNNGGYGSGGWTSYIHLRWKPSSNQINWFQVHG